MQSKMINYNMLTRNILVDKTSTELFKVLPLLFALDDA